MGEIHPKTKNTRDYLYGAAGLVVKTVYLVQYVQQSDMLQEKRECFRKQPVNVQQQIKTL